MRRFFNGIEKTILYLLSDGRCQSCGAVLGKGWHADHIEPYSKGGQTRIKNGQALCPICNLTKSNKTIMKHLVNFNLYPWQKEFAISLSNRYCSSDNKFLLHACVGSGKTFASAYAISQILSTSSNLISADFEFPNNNSQIETNSNVMIYCVAPQAEVKKSFSDEFQKFGYNLIHDKSEAAIYNNSRGMATTYQSVCHNYESFKAVIQQHKIRKEKSIVILDEIHHLGNNTSWGEAIKDAFSDADFILMLTGTPFRHDKATIPFAKYLETGIDKKIALKVDYSYNLAKGIENKIVCPISFRGSNAVIKDISCSDSYQNEYISTEDLNIVTRGDSDFTISLLNDANEQLENIRNYCNMPNAGALVLAKDITECEKIYEYLKTKYGEKDVEIIVSKRSQDGNDNSDDNDSINKITDFKRSNKKWLVSVKMISEGINIPRLRVCVYLSDVKTRLFFEQVVGRIVRARMDKKLGVIDMAYFFYPKHEELYKHATEISDEFEHILTIQESEYENECLEYVKKEYSERQKPLDIFKFAEIGDSSIVNQGQDISEHKNYMGDFKEKFGVAAAQDVEFYLANWAKNHNQKLAKSNTNSTIDSFGNVTDMCTEIRAKITKSARGLAGSIARRTGSPYEGCISKVYGIYQKEYGTFNENYDPKELENILYAIKNNVLGL